MREPRASGPVRCLSGSFAKTAAVSETAAVWPDIEDRYASNLPDARL